MSPIYCIVFAMMCGATASNLYGTIINYRRFKRMSELFARMELINDEKVRLAKEFMDEAIKKYDEVEKMTKEYEEMMAYTE